MHEHGPNCLEGPIRGSHAWWRGLAPREVPPEPPSGTAGKKGKEPGIRTTGSTDIGVLGDSVVVVKLMAVRENPTRAKATNPEGASVAVPLRERYPGALTVNGTEPLSDKPCAYNVPAY